MTLDSLNHAIYNYAMKPTDASRNFNIAETYHEMKQYASAVSFYIRAAELTDDENMKYVSLINSADCFSQQGSRFYTVEGLLQYAITIDGNKSTAYEKIANFYLKQKKWRECLLYATQGCSLVDNTTKEYLHFQLLIAESSWNIGLIDKSKEIILELSRSFPLESAPKEFLSRFGYPDTIMYKKDRDLNRYRYPFPGIEIVEKNYSKHMQDMFILSFLNGKTEGFYLEIGSGHPFDTNNTALLETQFNWKGISIDSNRESCYLFSEKRRNSIICADATEIDYRSLLDESCAPHQIDYLQIDCDEASLDILKQIPFDHYKFSVIHFEHDTYRLGNEIKEESRKILKDAGYKLVANDIAFNPNDSYEDWWTCCEPTVHQRLMYMNNDKNYIIPYLFYS